MKDISKIPSNKLLAQVTAWREKWRKSELATGPSTDEQKRQFEKALVKLYKTGMSSFYNMSRHYRSSEGRDKSVKHFVWCDSPLVAQFLSYDFRRKGLRGKIGFRGKKTKRKDLQGIFARLANDLIHPDHLKKEGFGRKLSRSLVKAFDQMRQVAPHLLPAVVSRFDPLEVTLSKRLGAVTSQSGDKIMKLDVINDRLGLTGGDLFDDEWDDDPEAAFLSRVKLPSFGARIHAAHFWCDHPWWRNRVRRLDFCKEVVGNRRISGKDLAVFKAAAEPGFRWIVVGDTAFISELPLIHVRNEFGVLHCETGPALQYADGFTVYSYGGVHVPKQVIMCPEKLSVRRINAEQNLEVRRVMIERFGPARFIKATGCKLAATRNDPLTGFPERLYHLGKGGQYMFVCTDPSTGRVYHLSVPDPNAWRSSANDNLCALAQSWLSHGLDPHITHRT